MNPIDIVCLLIILLFTLLGLWHGFLRGIFRLLAWALAIVGAYFANDLLSETISGILHTSSFSTTLVCMCIGFLVPFLALLFISHLVNRAITGTVAGRADRILGAVFGIAKAILICFVLLTILHILPFGGIVKESRDDSVAYAAYKGSLETMGYSSEPIDLVGIVERKASEKASKVAKEASEKAADAAKEAAQKVVEETVDSVVSNISEKASEVAKDAVKEIAPDSSK